MEVLASRKPTPQEGLSDYQSQLVDLIEDPCVLQAMDDQLFWTHELLSQLSTEQIDKLHPPYTWTIRQVIEHCANAERIFGYRILRFAAGDKTPLPGWDQNDFADARFGLGDFGQLVTELSQLRQTTLGLLRRIVPTAWDQSASASGSEITVRAIAWLAAGHLHHHLAIIEKRCDLQVVRKAST